MSPHDAPITVLAIGGEPATGKTTLVREIIRRVRRLGVPELAMQERTLRWLDLGAVVVLGVYAEGERFAGTDRLSMGVQPQAVAWMRREAWAGRPRLVVFEGDRLFNGKFLRELRDFEEMNPLNLVAWSLATSADELGRRHVERGDQQTEQWLKGRRTKTENLLRDAALRIERQEHATPDDTARLAALALSLVPVGRIEREPGARLRP